MRAGLLSVFLVLNAVHAAPPEIDFAKDVHPILAARCNGCHSAASRQGKLAVTTRDDLVQGGVSGPAVIPGNSKDSLLIQRVTGQKLPAMPMSGERLSPAEIDILRAWIDQGAKAPQQAAKAGWKPILAPRRPPLPKGAPSSANPVDAFLAAYFKRNRITPPAVVSDSVFLRRAYLDLWGLLPTPEERRAFLADRRPDKRARLVDALLANRKNFREHWISFWNDLLHNDEGVNYIGDRKSITPWLLDALADNMPYDQMVRELLNPAPKVGPEGFILGVNWRGDINASQRPVMQAAQNSAQVFLGVNLKCNSCHDSFISSWKLEDAYGLASFFSEEPLELVRCDAPTGIIAQPKFLYPELGPKQLDTSLAARRAAVAELFTKRENGRFARTFVNRIWQKLMGRGLVEPVDDMDAEPWDPDLLDWLAWEFAENKYDINFLLRRIMTSRAYQLPAVRSKATPEKKYVFRGPGYRRLTAEQFVDAISSVTGEWRVRGSTKPVPGFYSRDWRFKTTSLTRALGRPARDMAVTERLNDPTTLQMLELVNGRELARLLRRGALRMSGQLPEPPQSLFDSGVVGAGKAYVDIDITNVDQLWLKVVDHDSYNADLVKAGWMDAVLEGPGGRVRLVNLPAQPSVLTGEIQMRNDVAREALLAPIPSEIVFDIKGKGFTRFRAVAGVDESSLKSDVNAKIRFFIFPSKPDPEQLLRVAGPPPVPVADVRATPASLVSRVFLHLLNRTPTPAERRIALRYIIDPKSPGKVQASGLEDLLWSILLSPEFQYIS